ncbi:hypothetical protein HpMS107_04160 [Helicobacter pylori]
MHLTIDNPRQYVQTLRVERGIGRPRALEVSKRHDATGCTCDIGALDTVGGDDGPADHQQVRMAAYRWQPNAGDCSIRHAVSSTIARGSVERGSD